MLNTGGRNFAGYAQTQAMQTFMKQVHAGVYSVQKTPYKV